MAWTTSPVLSRLADKVHDDDAEDPGFSLYYLSCYGILLDRWEHLEKIRGISHIEIVGERADGDECE